MKLKRLLSTFLASTMMISMMSVTASAQNISEDAKNSWAAQSIERWVSEGIVKGDESGNFNPGKSLTRAEFAVILSNLLGLKDKAQNTFDDLEGDAWYTDAILKCAAAGIIYGSADGDKLNSNPNATITRQEAMVMFGRAIGVQPDANPNLSDFNDSSNVADWAAGYVSKMVDLGIISGVAEGVLGSTASIDRASTMAILDRSISSYITEPGTFTVNNSKGFVIVNVSESSEGKVVIKGEAEGVLISAGTGTTEVAAEGLKTNSFKVDSTSKVTLDSATTVTNVVVNTTAAVENKGTITNLEVNGQATVKNEGTITTVDINNEVKVENTGKIENANVNADKVIIDGEKPENVTIDDAVTEAPSTSTGEKIEETTTEKPTETPSTGGGGGGGGGSSTTSNYKVKVQLVNTAVETTVAQSGKFSDAFGKLNTTENIAIADGLLKDAVSLVSPEKLDQWQATFDSKYAGKIEDAISNSGLSDDDKDAARVLLTGITPANLETTNAKELADAINTLFANVTTDDEANFKILLDKLAADDIYVTVNGEKADTATLAKLLCNGSLTNWYNFVGGKEAKIFIQFGADDPELNDSVFNGLLADIASIKLTITK